MMSGYFVYFIFTGMTARQTEAQVIGPFDTLSIAKHYNKLSRDPQPKSMVDFGLTRKVGKETPEIIRKVEQCVYIHELTPNEEKLSSATMAATSDEFKKLKAITKDEFAELKVGDTVLIALVQAPKEVMFTITLDEQMTQYGDNIWSNAEGIQYTLWHTKDKAAKAGSMDFYVKKVIPTENEVVA